MKSARAPARRSPGGEGVSRLPGDAGLRTALDDLANQLCVSVDGNFDFAVHSALEDETLEKVSMLVNFVLDTARRGMSALHERNAALAEIDRAKTTFFSNASHELRTPLSLILGPIEDALARPGGALTGEGLALAHRNAVRLHRLVDALLDFSRIEGGRVQPRFEPVDLAGLTTQLVNVFRDAIERAGLTLAIDAPPLAAPVWIDRDMWEKIVLNLVSNAFKYTLQGGITVTLRPAGHEVELAVRDTGIGVAPEFRQRVFERFFRVPDARGRTHEGFGIGLAMIQELARLHGGSIALDDAPGGGSVFTVRIPREQAPPAVEAAARREPKAPSARLAQAFALEVDGWRDVAAPRPAAAPVAAAPRERARILLADDNADMRAYIENLLGEHWQVEAHADGEAALAAALRQPPDLVLTDIMMPGRDGFALLRGLRENAATRYVPVVLLSARSGPEAVAEGLESGADDYLAKPFAARELIARVRTHLELSRLRMDNAIINRIGTLLSAKLDLQGVVQTLTDEATLLCGAGFGAFFYNVVDAAGERYTLYTLSGAPRAVFEKFPLPRNTPLFAPTFNGEGVVRLDDVTKDPRYGKVGPYHGMPPGHLPVRSYLAVPVVSRAGAVLGGLFLGHGEPGVFTERSERLLLAVATQAAAAIDNANLYEAAQRARAEAESANAAKDQFLAMLGHELRNPLAPIVSALDVMELQGVTAGATERGVIRRQVEHLGRLVDDLLDVSRITRGLVELDRAPVELARVAAKGLEISGPYLRERAHTLTVSIPEQGLVVDGDLARLAQVVANLVNNAAKYSDRGAPIVVTGGRDGGDVVLRVRDRGIGIAPEMLPRIFEHFVQGPQSLARSQGGLGLGLAIVRSLVAQHGGTVAARSDGPGLGSEFEVRLPLHGAAAEPPRPRAAPARAGAVARAAGRRILVVDDNADAARLLARALAMVGHESRVATDGAQALAVAHAFRPDIALLDLGLPEVDGFEVARRLRRALGAGVRLVALTGYGEETARRDSAAAGFDDHLVKPVDVAQIDALIARAFADPAAP